MADYTDPPLCFMYTNWRGERRARQARPIRVYYGATQWHPRPQWLMEAIDVDTGEVRTFAMEDMEVCKEKPKQE